MLEQPSQGENHGLLGEKLSIRVEGEKLQDTQNNALLCNNRVNNE